MRLKKCENGHFYDESKYAFCPHCRKNSGQEADNLTVAIELSTGGKEDELVKQHMSAWTEEITNESKLQKNVSALQIQEQDLTVGYYSQKMITNPVVGWLVCLNGDNKGKSYELHAGRNFVGRAAEMDIVLEGDKSVSRIKHAVFIYDAKGKKYYAQPGESRELFYVNGEVVLNNVILKPYDKVFIGQTELLFIALCGEIFTWDE